jgi:glycosyltransferase involved in cell wall biosynthesis
VTPPRVSFGLAVRNGVETLRRCLDSILGQELGDLELVVSDNASEDGTPDLLREVAARDARVRVHANPTNIGLIANVNRVFDLSRGTFFRWISADDWLEPGYATACVAALEANPEAIAATTYFRLHADDGRSRYEEYRGEMLESGDPARRFARMLWFFHAGDARYDPVYALFRREALARTRRIRMMENADWMLAAELALLGPFVHVPRCLAHRTRAYRREADRRGLMRRYHPERAGELKASSWRLYRELLAIVDAAGLEPGARARCRRSALRFLAAQARHRGRLHWASFRRRRLGLTRRTLGLSRAPDR